MTFCIKKYQKATISCGPARLVYKCRDNISFILDLPEMISYMMPYILYV